jgi:hypothetical protein
MTPYRHVCPTPCVDAECDEEHPDGLVCHERHRSAWHRTHSPAACEALLRGEHRHQQRRRSGVITPHTVDGLLSWLQAEGWFVSIGTSTSNGVAHYDIVADHDDDVRTVATDDFTTLLAALEHAVRLATGDPR